MENSFAERKLGIKQAEHIPVMCLVAKAANILDCAGKSIASRPIEVKPELSSGETTSEVLLPSMRET